MIRVIKPGMQEFYAFCTHCGCECDLDCCDSSTQTAVNAAITQLDSKVKEYAT